MKRLWAPWRLEYILGEKPGYCIFCTMPAEDKDRENYILYRGRENFVIMNKYPYNNGHLMVIPYKHAEIIEDFSDSELTEAMALTRECCRIMRDAMHPQGFNVGLNVGQAAGAGIKEHLHFHIVPRWEGDTNFMSVVEDTRVMPQHLTETYEQLRPGFEKLAKNGM
jgi:ATP adenylyltransferase